MAGRRAFVRLAVTRQMSTASARGLVKGSRRHLTYESHRNDDELVNRLKELAAAHPRYDSRHLSAMLRRDGRGSTSSGFDGCAASMV